VKIKKVETIEIIFLAPFLISKIKPGSYNSYSRRERIKLELISLTHTLV
jgi:hypothetical protein